MSKTTLGIVFLIVAIFNIYWAIEITALNKRKGSSDEKVGFSNKAKRLSYYSRFSYLLVSVFFAIYLIFWKK